MEDIFEGHKNSLFRIVTEESGVIEIYLGRLDGSDNFILNFHPYQVVSNLSALKELEAIKKFEIGCKRLILGNGIFLNKRYIQKMQPLDDYRKDLEG